MEDLFEFKITNQNETYSDSYISRFIEVCLDPYELFWGGGYSDHEVNGNVVGKVHPLTLNSIIEKFILFFEGAFLHFEIFEQWKEFISADFFNREQVVIKFVPLN